MGLHYNQFINFKFGLLQASIFMSYSACFGFLVSFLTEYGYSDSEIGFITMLPAIATVFLQPVVGYVCDTLISFKKLVIILTLTVIPLSLLTPSIASILAVLCIFIVLVNVIESSCMSVIDMWSIKLREKRRKISFSLTRAMGSLGYAFASLIIGRILSVIGAKNVFYIYAVLMLITCLAALLIEDIPCANHGGENRTKISMFSGLKILMQNKRYKYFLVGMICLDISTRMGMTFLPRIVDGAGGNEASYGFALFITAVLEAPLMVSLSKVFAKKGVKSEYIFGAALAAQALLLIFLGAAQALWFIYFAVMIQAVGNALQMPAQIEYINQTAPKEITTTALGISRAVSGLFGGVLGNFLGGIVVQFMGLHSAYFVSAGITIAGLLIFTFGLKATNQPNPVS